MSELASGSRRLPVSAWVFDSALALVAAGLSTAFYVFEPPGIGLPRGRFALGCALVLLHTLPLAGRRRFPGAVLALVVASGLAFAALGLPRIFSGWPSWWRSIRWRPTAAGGSHWPAWPQPRSALWLSSSPRVGPGAHGRQ